MSIWEENSGAVNDIVEMMERLERELGINLGLAEALDCSFDIANEEELIEEIANFQEK